AELGPDAVRHVRAALGVVAEERDIAVRFPAGDADATEEIDERQRIVAYRRHRERSRVESGRCRTGAADDRRACSRQGRVRIAEVDVIDLDPDRIERPDAADRLEPAAG